MDAGRQGVFVADFKKSISLKPSNLRYCHDTDDGKGAGQKAETDGEQEVKRRTGSATEVFQQIAFADRVVITKSDLVEDMSDLARVAFAVRESRPYSQPRGAWKLASSPA